MSVILRVILTEALMVCVAGEKLKVSACIENNSSREIKPKYCLYSKHVFLARGRRKVATTDLLKEVGEPIAPSATEKVTRVLTLPKDLDPSILNCSNIEAGYKLKVSMQLTRRLAEKRLLALISLCMRTIMFSRCWLTLLWCRSVLSSFTF